jgi:hypothetical protein
MFGIPEYIPFNPLFLIQSNKEINERVYSKYDNNLLRYHYKTLIVNHEAKKKRQLKNTLETFKTMPRVD